MALIARLDEADAGQLAQRVKPACGEVHTMFGSELIPQVLDQVETEEAIAKGARKDVREHGKILCDKARAAGHSPRLPHLEAVRRPALIGTAIDLPVAGRW